MIKDILTAIGLFYLLPISIVSIIDIIDGDSSTIERDDPDE